MLIARYRGVICDLDGVVYRGATAVPGAVETLNHLVAEGVALTFATNNASRPPETVRDHLRDLGIGEPGWSVVTSSQAAAAYLAQRMAPGARVLAVGGPGVVIALAEAGLTPVRVAELSDAPIEAMVQGLGTDVTWLELAEVGYLAQRGVPWVATNRDLTIPTSRGPAPGNGSLVAVVQTTTDVTPHVTGKPGPALFELARSHMGTRQRETLVCGDRLDTDIAGANAAHLDSLFVLSGACHLRDLAFAAPAERPTYAAGDLSGLREPLIRLSDSLTDLVDVKPGGVLEILRPAQANTMLNAVVATSWAATTAGTTISDDLDMWRRLEKEIGISPSLR